MIFSERSYNTEIFRPKPIVRWEVENQLLMVATNWGSRDAGQKALDEISKYVTAAQGDVEVTTPFEYLPQLTGPANSLRIATLLANELIFRSDNRNEFNAGLELTLILKTKSQLAWLQIGQPNLYFKRANSRFQPISNSIDLSFDLKTQSTETAPLPKELLGVESVLSPQAGHFLIFPGDQLLMLSRSKAPLSFGEGQVSLKEITTQLNQETEEMPYWLGLIDFD